MPPRPILVTGALGNVGSEIMKNLIRQGAPARPADYQLAKVAERFGSQISAVELDFLRPETFTPALKDVERLFLMRPPAISDMKRTLIPFVERARSSGVQQVVFLSLIGIENQRFVPHYKVEQAIIRAGIPHTFLRASFFMQNLSTTHRAEIREHDEIYLPVGNARTSFIDVRDIGAVAAKALTEPGHTDRAYELTGSEALDYYQVARIFSEELGRQITYRDPPALAYFLRSVRAGNPLAFSLVTTFLYLSTRRGMAARVTGEVEKLLGRPPVDFRQYVRDYRECWRG